MDSFNISTNIIRDSNKSLNYIPTRNSILIANQLCNDYKIGIRVFNIIGSYGTGKSSFLWAFEQTIKGKARYFNVNLRENNCSVDFIKLIGSYKSLKEVIAEKFDLSVEDSDEKLFSEIYNYYHDLGYKSLLIIEIDEFGKFLEFAVKNNPDQELYFIQKFAEFVNNSENNILLLVTQHQNFDSYSLGLNNAQQNEWTKVKGRFKELAFNEPIEQLLYLFSEHISAQSQKKQDEKALSKLINLLLSSKVFNVDEYYVDVIAKKLYPLDPISSYIIAIALQRYGQNERSLFSFLESNDHTSLYQHKILDKNFYGIPEVYDYVSYNLFTSINSKYNPDFSAWKNIKSSLERLESDFTENIEEYSKLIKTIGLLALMAKPGAVLDKNFIVDYAKIALQIANPEKLLSNLLVRKNIFFRNYNCRYILAEGTDLDLEVALHKAAHELDEVKDVVSLLKKNYPLDLVLAKRAMFETGTPRTFQYVISSEPISKKPEGEIDGFINLIFNEENICDEIERISKEHGEAIIYGFYKNSKEVKDLLFEIEKTQKVIAENSDDKIAVKELQNILSGQRSLLNHRIITSLFAEKSPVVWIFDGEEKNLPTKKSFNQFLSEICQIVYSHTPYFNNELVNKHKISGTIHGARKSYFRALVNNWHEGQLGFPKDKYPAEKTIFLSLLENNGIRSSENTSIPNNDNRFRYLWDASNEFLNNSKVSKRNISEFVDILREKPFKLKQGFIDIWIPTFLFIKRNEFALFNEGIYTPNINNEILELISKVPKDFEIKTFSLEGVKLDIFNSYRNFLNIESKTSADNKTFIETIKPFLAFYRSLSEYSKNTKRLSKESLAIREAIANSKDPEKSFFEDFPIALGFSIPKIQKERSELESFIGKLESSIRELRSSYDELINRFESFIQESYFDSSIDFINYQNRFQNRYKKLRKHLLLNLQKSFVQRIDLKIEERDAWLSSLAQVLTGKSLKEFSDEDELILYDKFDEMILNLDSLNQISNEVVDELEEVAIDVHINSFEEGMSKKIIRLPKKKKVEIENLENQIKKLLSNNKSVDLAAVTSVLKELL